MADDIQPAWGALEKRFGAGTENRPRRLLALDGGGIRGVLTLQVLIKMEDILRERSGQGEDFRLCHFFDYIGGTSTGAIIAAGLAAGKSARWLSEFYKEVGPAMFEKAFILHRLKNLYKSEPLADKLKEVFGEQTTLGSDALRCLLLIVTRNVTTDSPWAISSNPFARYNAPNRPDRNSQIPLWQLVRASTAAPIYFPPESVQWDPADPSKAFIFEDGGLTPYNNPAFLLVRMATQRAYRLGWATGEKNLLVVSIGTGSAPKTDAEAYAGGKNALANLVNFPAALMYGAQVDQDINCRIIGRCVYGGTFDHEMGRCADIDRELGDLIPRREDGSPIPVSVDLGRQFLYARYNAELSASWLKARGLGDVDPASVAQLDSVAHIDDLVRVGQALAEEVSPDHFCLERFGHFEEP
jgi:patatin-like phospholipase/acyl hydrolase